MLAEEATPLKVFVEPFVELLEAETLEGELPCNFESELSYRFPLEMMQRRLLVCDRLFDIGCRNPETFRRSKDLVSAPRLFSIETAHAATVASAVGVAGLKLAARNPPEAKLRMTLFLETCWGALKESRTLCCVKMELMFSDGLGYLSPRKADGLRAAPLKKGLAEAHAAAHNLLATFPLIVMDYHGDQGMGETVNIVE